MVDHWGIRPGKHYISVLVFVLLDGPPRSVRRHYIEQQERLILACACLAAFTTGLKAAHRRPYW